MPRIKIIGTCSVENCSRSIDALNYCTKHYQRYRKYGTPNKCYHGDKRKHRQYYNWASRKRGLLCKEWMDFWQFVRDVGEEPPSKLHYLRRPDKTRPFGPDNFTWIEHIRRLPGETKKEYWKRKGSIRKYVYIPPEIVSQKLKEQNELCAICKNPETRLTRTKKVQRLCLDHCHETGKIRELLCGRCNLVLGRMTDSIELLQSMINYLKKHHPERFTLPAATTGQ